VLEDLYSALSFMMKGTMVQVMKRLESARPATAGENWPCNSSNNNYNHSRSHSSQSTIIVPVCTVLKVVSGEKGGGRK